MTPELALLLECIRPELSPDQAARISQLTQNADLRWDSVLALARRHQVLPQLTEALGASGWEAVPGRVRSELNAYCAALETRNAYLSSQLVAVIRALERDGVRALSYKGPALESLYAGSARRSFGDLDILISPQDVLAAEVTLTALGFRLDPPFADPEQAHFVAGLAGWRKSEYLNSRAEHHFRRDIDRVLVDVHVKLADSYIRVPVRFEELLARAEYLAIDGERVLVPCLEHMLLIVAVNAAKDCFSRLQHLRDLAEIMRTAPGLDWFTVFETANRLGIRRILDVCLSLSERFMGTPIPSGARSNAAVREIVCDATRRLTSEAARPPLLSREYTRIQLRMRERITDRLWYVLYLLLTPTVADWMIIPLPRRLRHLYLLVRPVRLMLRYGAIPTAARSSASGRPRPD